MKTICLFLLMLMSMGCGYSSNGSGTVAAGAPSISGLSPNTTAMGGAAFNAFKWLAEVTSYSDQTTTSFAVHTTDPDDPGLGTGPGTQLRTARPAGEVLLGFGPVDRGHRAAHHDLSLHWKPGEHQTGVRVAERLRAFARFVIGEEDEPALVVPLEQDDAGARPPATIRRRPSRARLFRTAG